MDEKDVDRFDEAAGELAGAARESYKAAVNRAFAARESNTRLAWSFFEDWADALEARSELDRRAARNLAELAREQQEAFWELPAVAKRLRWLPRLPVLLLREGPPGPRRRLELRLGT